MCRSCGAIVGAGEPQCAVCGTPTTAAQPTADSGRRAPDKETIRFARAVMSRPYKFTIAILVANLFVFLLMWESSGTSFQVLQSSFPEGVLLAYGAQINMLINAPAHQWWRLVTPMFVHINFLHLLTNMFSLLMIGPFVEKLYGSAKFVVFWVCTGIAGSIGTYLSLRPALAHGALGTFLFRSADVPAAGASGALFGLIGVLFVFGIKYRRELPEGFKRVFGTGLLPIILINLFIGFIGRGFIGNAAHLSGLLAGALLAIFVDYRRPGVRAGITAAWRVFQVLAVVVIALGAYKIVVNFNRPVPPAIRPATNPKSSVFVNYVNAMNELQEKVAAVIHNDDFSDLGVTSYRAMRLPAPDTRAAELRERLLLILSRMIKAPAADSPAPGQESDRSPQIDQNVENAYREWREDYDEWLKEAVKVYTAPA